ncbi:M20/M25/M40 family metallo-hydrolase [Saccharothrix luteola]|uniref:M20/M25/M40 family metallo-hydrolase n=1 Tax=Saccharothrix luteola TaxID=2893018 RepID=UPI001E377F35|nr:M20/M25/M40 family metallo-hydrolase [Saccharothrix luteola]MCC8246429.1 M20/M25/M40 family metallo-hydrolase [Saccharothrix luteola]
MADTTIRTPATDVDHLREQVQELMPHLREVLKMLVGIPSIATVPPTQDMERCSDAIAAEFRRAGLNSARTERISHQGQETAPIVFVDEPGPPGAPTVLFFSHYDVAPVQGQEWSSEPFTPTEVKVAGDVRLVGRGVSDEKAGICAHLGMAQLFEGKPPVHLKLVVEGEEKSGRRVLADYLGDPGTQDDRFSADVIVVANSGKSGSGVPAITSTVRGFAVYDLEVATLERPVHSGVFGGPVPDAFMVLAQLLATLHDHEGDVAVQGLNQDQHDWNTVDEERMRADAGLLSGVSLIGTGSLEQRLYGKPSINVVGLDAVGLQPVDRAAHVLCARAKARISVRLAPGQDVGAVQSALREHLEQHRPWGIDFELTPVTSSSGFNAAPGGQYRLLAGMALAEAHGAESAEEVGQGGAGWAPHVLKRLNPESDVVLWGVEDSRSNNHGADESISYTELERLTLAEALLVSKAAAAAATSVPRARKS